MRVIFEMISTDHVSCYIPCFLIVVKKWKFGKYIPYFSKFPNIFQSKRRKYDVGIFFYSKTFGNQQPDDVHLSTWATSTLIVHLSTWATSWCAPEHQPGLEDEATSHWREHRPCSSETFRQECLMLIFKKYTFAIAHQPWSEEGKAIRRRWRRRRRGKSWSWPSPPARSQRCVVLSLEGVLGGMLTP